jgi:hypothetical protein
MPSARIARSEFLTDGMLMGDAFLRQLGDLGVKEKLLAEIRSTAMSDELTNGIVETFMKSSLVFTNYRIISISKIPLVGLNTEWFGSKIVLMGGNFQFPYSMLSEIRLAKSRIRTPHTLHSNALIKLIKAVGPSISLAIWPYEIQLIDHSPRVINRVYSISEENASSIRDLSIKSGLKFTAE